ncbi:MAG: DpnI domain-containing protein [Candidatus Anammoxibacter sp.]
MDLKFNISVARGYKSKSQIARVLTENWVSRNAYCPSCGNKRLNEFANNSPVADFFCNDCKAEYELKSKKDIFSPKIVDGAFKTMIERINSDNNPHFFFLNYSNKELLVKNFLVIPKYYFVDDIIERRKPLSPNARRAGWTGCNILLQNIPEIGKIFFIKDGIVNQPEKVIRNWSKTSFLLDQKKECRGWTIEIMKILDKISDKHFSLKEVYAFETELKQKFPNNNFIKDKIRQQLQVLRDKGLVGFKGRGSYVKT